MSDPTLTNESHPHLTQATITLRMSTDLRIARPENSQTVWRALLVVCGLLLAFITCITR